MVGPLAHGGLVGIISLIVMSRVTPRLVRMTSTSGISDASELPHLGTFVRAAELGSFTSTAVELGMTQAAVSQRIAALEKQLRVSLFERRPPRLRLTESGRLLFDYARRIIELHAEARESLGRPPSPVTGDLPLAASSVPGEFLLPALLAGFREEYPHVRVRASVGDSGSALKDVERGLAILGLVGWRVEGRDLEYRPLGPDRLVLVVPPSHPWAGLRSISPGRLAGESLIVREVGSGSRGVLQQALDRSGMAISTLGVTLELGSNAAILDGVRRGLGIAFLSRLAVRRDIESGELHEIEVEGLDLRRHFYLVHDRRRPLTPAASIFLHFAENCPRPNAISEGS